jgi:hypothetical protein
MELVPLNLRERLLQNGAEVRENDDHIPLLKLFTPDANATWLISALDPDDPDQAFALCDLGMGFPELGYISITELSTIKGRLGLPIERDLHFQGKFPLSVYARAARDVGRIVECEQSLRAHLEPAQRIAASSKL